jgi:hypothetical protein
MLELRNVHNLSSELSESRLAALVQMLYAAESSKNVRKIVEV